MLNRKWWLASSLAIVVALGAACGDDDDDDDDDDSGTPVATIEATDEPTAAAAAGPNRISVTAEDFAFDAPASIAAGLTTIELSNSSAEESHHAQLLKLNDGVTLDDFAAAAQESEAAVFQLVTFAGGAGIAGPQGTSQATVNLDEGQYVFVCFVPSPSDNIPHIAKGMVQPVEVTAAEGEPAEAPEADLEVGLIDFGFEAPETVAAGETVIAVTNNGAQPHEMALLKLAEGATPDDVTAIFSAPPDAPAPEGPPPFTDAGGFQAIDANGEGWTTIDFESGATYALICFVPDSATGAPHFALGMLDYIEVE